MIKISTSILSSPDRIKCIKELNNTDTDLIHIDSMDNKFVPNFQMPVDEINKILLYNQIPADIHLMVENPEEYIRNIKGNNINNITIHVENKNIKNIINLIKSYNYKVGLAIKPNTNLNKLEKYIKNKYKDITVEVDGGINDTTINKIKDTIDIAVVGSYITNSNDYQEAINSLKN